MAWLEEMARTAKFAGLGKLAKAAVDHPDWPDGGATNPRSVENQLRALDQKKRSGQLWLDHRPDVRDILAELLNVSPESLDPGTAEPEGPADPRVPLHELREAEPIDLRRERPFPGIPLEVLEPKEWGLTWWFAMSGAGRTVVGRWLEAQKKAVFIRKPRWADAVPEIPAEGDVYVELTLPDESDAARWAEGFEGRNICVAAPFLPIPIDETKEIGRLRQEWAAEHEATNGTDGDAAETGTPEIESGWTITKTPPKEEWVEDLVRWVGRRMKSGGGFEPEAALGILRKRRLARWLHTPGDYLGFCGVIEHLGVNGWDRVDIDRLALAFLAARIERTDLSPRSAWAPRELWSLIVGASEGAIVNSLRSDGYVREADLGEWIRDDVLPCGDEASVLARLVEAENPTTEDLTYVRGRLRPTRRTAIRELVRLHLLEPVGEGVVEFRPAWLAMLAAEVSLGRLVTAPERGLGGALLHPARAAGMVDLLRSHWGHDNSGAVDEADRALGDALCAWALAHFQPALPASVSLLEGLFTALGTALLDSRVDHPLGPLRQLWDAQMRVAVLRYTNAPVQPLVLAFDSPNRRLATEWYLAALAISERLVRAGHTLPQGALCPWTNLEVPEHIDTVLGSIEMAFLLPLDGQRQASAAKPLPFLADAARLARRIFHRLGPASARASSLLFAPFALLDAVKSGATPDWQGRLHFDYELDVLVALATDDDLPVDRVLAALWRLGPNPSHFPFWRIHERHSEHWQGLIWRALPAELLRTTYREWARGHVGELGWAYLTDEQWEAVLDVWATDAHGGRPGLEYIPETAAERVLAERLAGFDGWRTYGALWARFPDLCAAAAVTDLLHPPPPSAPTGVAWPIPEAWVAPVVNKVQARLPEILAREESRLYVLRWAHQQVEKRASGWMAAWNLLMDVVRVSPHGSGEPRAV